MEGKERCNQSTLPNRAGGTLEKRKKEYDGSHVKNKIGQMMQAWVHSEKRIVEHVGQPGEGMPEIGMRRCKCPSESVPGQSILYVWIGGNVHPIIENDEFMTANLPENGQDQHGQSQ